MVCTTITVAPTLDVTSVSVAAGGPLGYTITVVAVGTGTRTLNLTLNDVQLALQDINAGTWQFNVALDPGFYTICATIIDRPT